jgi:voltage-dependent potassium channel beta subunit
MQYRRLGGSGLKVSALSFGSWVTFGTQLDTAAAEAMMRAAYDAGVNFFDNAEGYANGASETIMGQVLRNTGWRRDSYTVSSKVFFGAVPQPGPLQRGLSRKHVHDACHQALARLQVEYLDLFFCHRPDPETPIEETVRTMHDLIQQGKVLYWGTSEWSADEIMAAYAAARQYHLTPPTMEQPQYNLLHRTRIEREYARLYTQIGLGTTVWSPLATGVLTGKYNDGIPQDARLNLPGYEWLQQRLAGEAGPRTIAKVKRIAVVADQLGVSMPKLAIAWCLKNPHVSTVILGASRVAQLTENLTALEVVPRLTDEVMAALDDAVKD